MSRIFDALKKAHLGRPAAEAAPSSRAPEPVPPPDHGLRGLKPAPMRREPDRAVPGAEATPLVIPIREATELLSGVLGEPFPGTGVAGVRERLARALGID